MNQVLDALESGTGFSMSAGYIKTNGIFGNGFLGRDVARLKPAPEEGLDFFMIYRKRKYYERMKEVVTEYDKITGN